jgi:hypothetical protein
MLTSSQRTAIERAGLALVAFEQRLKHAPAPPRSYGQRLEHVESTSPRGKPCHGADKAGYIDSAPLYTCRVALTLTRQRRGSAGNALGTTIKYLRRTTSGAAGSSLGTPIKYLRRTTRQRPGRQIKYLRHKRSGAAGKGLRITTKYLRRATSGAAGNGLSRYRGLLMCSFTTSAPHSPCGSVLVGGVDESALNRNLGA